MNIFIDVFALIMLVQLIIYHFTFVKVMNRKLFDFAAETKYFILKFISLFIFKINTCCVCLSFWISLIFFQDLYLALNVTLLSHFLDLLLIKLKK